MTRVANLRALGLALALVAALPACHYEVGYRAVGDAREVAVPIFSNRTLRRGYEHALTAHLRRRILDQTPLQLAREGSGAPVLEGSIVAVSEALVVPNTNDTAPPRASSITINVSVVLRSPGAGRGPARILVGGDRDADGEPDGPAELSETETWVPELGQTRDSAADRVLRKLAERIVDLLERGWGGPQER